MPELHESVSPNFLFLLLPFFFIAINLLFYLLPLFFTYTHKHTHIQVQDGIISTSPPMHMTDLSPLVMVAPS